MLPMTAVAATYYTTDQSGLYGTRLTLGAPDDHIVLPEIISKEPLGPAVRQGDDQWYDVVKWTYFALLNAEELGITQANVEEMKNSENPEIKRVLGVEADTKIGTDLGLTNDWVVNIVKAVGNYGEMFESNVGQRQPAEDRAWRQRSLDEGWSAVRNADPLIRKPRPEKRIAVLRAPIIRGVSMASQDIVQPVRSRPGFALLRSRRSAASFFRSLFLFSLSCSSTGSSNNTVENLRRSNIASGFGFLRGRSGFDISDSLIAYSSDSTFGRALIVGFLNTIVVAVVGSHHGDGAGIHCRYRPAFPQLADPQDFDRLCRSLP